MDAYLTHAIRYDVIGADTYCLCTARRLFSSPSTTTLLPLLLPVFIPIFDLSTCNTPVLRLCLYIPICHFLPPTTDNLSPFNPPVDSPQPAPLPLWSSAGVKRSFSERWCYCELNLHYIPVMLETNLE